MADFIGSGGETNSMVTTDIGRAEYLIDTRQKRFPREDLTIDGSKLVLVE